MPEKSTDTLDWSMMPFWMWDTMAWVQPTATDASVGYTLDSLLPVREVVPMVQRPSMFRHHSLQAEHTSVGVRPPMGEPAWVFVVLVLLSGLICLYYRIRKIKLKELFQSTVDDRALDRMVRDRNLNRGVVMVSMGLLLVAAVTLLATRRLLPEEPWWIYVLASLVVGLLYVARNGLMRWLGNAFERRQEVTLYITSNYVYHLLEASLLTVGLFFYFYLPAGDTAMLVVVLLLLGVGFMMRMIRGGKIILSRPNGNSFYIFYYLCIVELIPALVAVRLFILQ